MSLLILLALGLFTYSNALNHPFMIDDHAFFDEMDHRWENLFLQFIPDKAKALQLEGAKTEVYYRPLALAIPKMFYLAFGDKTYLFHISSFVLFVIACWMVFLLVRRISGDAFLALLTAVFYLVHPLNGIIVNFKTGVVFAVQMICMIGSLFCIVGLQDPGNPATQKRRFWDSGVLGTWGASVLFILALFCHESAMALPFYAVMFFAVEKTKAQSVRQLMGDGISLRRYILDALRATWPLWMTLVLYFVFRLRWASLNENVFGKFAGYDMTMTQYFATVFKMGWWYLSRLFAPEGIVISVFFPVERAHVLAWLLAGAVMFSAWTVSLVRFYRLPVIHAALWLVAFGFGLLCVGSVFHGQDLMIEPHWFVFPSVGIFMLIAYGIGQIAKSPLRTYALSAVVLLTVSWIFMSRSYNALWHNERNYCFYWLKQNPDFKPIHMYIARSYFSAGELDKAAVHYKEALTGQYPDYLMYANLGTIAFLKRNFNEAEYYLKRALAIEPRTKVALNTLAILMLQKGDAQEAERYLRLAIKVNRFNIAARWNLALLCERSGRGPQALALYREILAIDPGHAGALSKLRN